ncbi:hypothetical protein [Microbispora oryzae]|uniref:hypothetical protein n=1 Tax=Microbispora oryzae TaxID=2806554 RepID=UPI001E3AAC86|nr:hypothetical protein [Microbispora oryzae]
MTFAWSPAFTAAPVVAVGVQGAAGFRSATITANSPSSTTVRVLAAASVTVLGIGVLAAGVPTSGVTVHLVAVAP